MIPPATPLPNSTTPRASLPVTFPRLLISGLSGGSGKTTVSLGLARCFATQLPFSTVTPAPDDFPVRPLELPWETTLAFMYGPRPVQTFKKGPDYIDAAWLGLAARCVTKTLDPYFSSPSVLRQQFVQGCRNASCALIEGNRGLYDGVDSLGTCSSAHLAKTLDAPVLLVVDCTKMTRTVAALVLGCVQLDKDVVIGGVILNRLGTTRQEKLIRDALAHHTEVPVFGALPRLHEPLLPERSMGLAAIEDDSSKKLDALCRFIKDHVDTNAIWNLANTLPAGDASLCHPDLTDPYPTDANVTAPLPDVFSTPLSMPLQNLATQTSPETMTDVADTSLSMPDDTLPDIFAGVSPCPVTTTTPCTTAPYSPPHTSVQDPLSSFGLSTDAPDKVPPANILENIPAESTATGEGATPSQSQATNTPPHTSFGSCSENPLIGYVYDNAIWFYYAENLEALHAAGARLRRLSLFSAEGWQDIDGLYVGGGQIDAYIQQISASPQLEKLRSLADKGLPIYLEGSSLAIACREIAHEDTAYPMAGIFDATMTHTPRPQGLGYTRALTTQPTPFFAMDESVVGHQFNFMRFQASPPPPTYLLLSKGQGLYSTPAQNEALHQHDGLVYKNTCASLTHIFAPAMPGWAPRFVRQCIAQKNLAD